MTTQPEPSGPIASSATGESLPAALDTEHAKRPRRSSPCGSLDRTIPFTHPKPPSLIAPRRGRNRFSSSNRALSHTNHYTQERVGSGFTPQHAPTNYYAQNRDLEYTNHYTQERAGFGFTPQHAPTNYYAQNRDLEYANPYTPFHTNTYCCEGFLPTPPPSPPRTPRKRGQSPKGKKTKRNKKDVGRTIALKQGSKHVGKIERLREKNHELNKSLKKVKRRLSNYSNDEIIAVIAEAEGYILMDWVPDWVPDCDERFRGDQWATRASKEN
jgi:hypothetical protein